MKKNIIALSIVILISFSLNCFSVFGNSASYDVWFSDVPEGYWAQSSIDSLYSKNIVTGFDNGVFRPNNKVTRAQFCVMFGKAIDGSEVSYKGYFKDVAPDRWYTGWIELLSGSSITQGVGNNTFNPDGYITREQAAKIIAVALAQKQNTTLAKLAEGFKKSFIDYSNISLWAIDSVKALVMQGIMQGSNNKFRPMDPLTRAECCVLISNFLSKIPAHQEISLEQLAQEEEHIVTVKTYNKNNQLIQQCFGLIATGDGKIVTLNSLFLSLTGSTDDSVYSAQVVFKSGEVANVKSYTKSNLGLTVLRIDSSKDFSPVKFANSEFLNLNEDVYGIMYDSKMVLSYINMTTQSSYGAFKYPYYSLELPTDNSQIGFVFNKLGKVCGIIISPQKSIIMENAVVSPSNSIQPLLYSTLLTELHTYSGS